MKYCNFGFICARFSCIFTVVKYAWILIWLKLNQNSPREQEYLFSPFIFLNTNKLPNEKLLFTAIYYHFIHTFGRWYLLKIFFAIIRSCQACRLSYHKEKSQYNSGLTAHSFFAFLLYWLDCFIFFWLVVLIWLG